MSSSWEAYFEPGYDNLEEIKEPLKESLYFGGMCFLISLGLFINLNGYKYDTARKLEIPFSSRPAIIKQIELLETQNSILESKIIILNHKFTQDLEKQTQNILNKFDKLVAMDEEKGKGVILKLNDSTKPLTFGENPNLMIVHNLDLLAIVNELWANGAKAISVNDQRVTSTTEFNCIGPVILINNSRIVPPFEIKAIGDPEKLEGTLLKGYIKNYKLQDYGISFSINKSKQLTVPASTNTLKN